MTSQIKMLKATLTACVSSLAALSVPMAQAQDGFTLDVSAGLDASTDKDFTAQRSGGAIGVNATLRPNYVFSDSVNFLRIGGDAQITEYFGDEPSDYTFGGSLTSQRRMSERLTLTGNLAYSRSKRANAPARFLSFQSNPLDNTTPGGAVPQAPSTPGVQLSDGDEAGVTDPTLLGRRVKSDRLSASVGADYIVSARTNLNLAIGSFRSSYDLGDLEDHRGFTVDLAYQRRVSERMTIVVSPGYSNVDYDLGSKIEIIRPHLGVTIQAGSQSTFKLNAGPSFVNYDQRNGLSSNRTNFSANANLCQSLERGSFCVGADRGYEATARGGVRLTHAANIAYLARLGVNNSLQLVANVDRRSPDEEGLFEKSTSAGGSARYSHTIGQNLWGFASVGYRSIWEGSLDQRDNAFVTVGISKKFGARQ